MPTQPARPIVQVLLSLAIIILLPTLASANWMGGVGFDRQSPGYLPYFMDLLVSLDYKITETEGARIYVQPMTGGIPTPGSATAASAYLPMGEGKATRMFRVNSGSVVVDQVRIRMMTYDDSAILLEFFVDTEFNFGPYAIFNIQFGKFDYSTMIYGEDLNMGFELFSPGPDNVRVIARPYFDGSLVPGAVATGGRPMPPRSSSHQHFDFPDADADINQVRFTMTNNDGSETLLEFDQDVHYFWRETGVTNMTFSSSSPSNLHNSQNVLIDFDYNNPTVDLIVLEARPYQGGSSATGSEFEAGGLLPPGKGSTSRYFGSSGTTEIDQIRLVGTNEGGSTTFLDILVPVSYTFSPHAVTDIATVPGSTAVLDFDEDLLFEFAYQTDHVGGVTFQVVPYSGGAENPDFISGTPALYPSGSGIATASFRLIDSAAVLDVDGFMIRIFDENLSQLLEEYSFDADFAWRGTGWASAVPQPGAGSWMLGQNYPNPFNPTTSIPVHLDAAGHVRLAVYDLRGRLVRTLVDKTLVAGRHEIPFDGTGFASGAYHYRITVGGDTRTRAMTLLK